LSLQTNITKFKTVDSKIQISLQWNRNVGQLKYKQLVAILLTKPAKSWLKKAPFFVPYIISAITSEWSDIFQICKKESSQKWLFWAKSQPRPRG